MTDVLGVAGKGRLGWRAVLSHVAAPFGVRGGAGRTRRRVGASLLRVAGRAGRSGHQVLRRVTGVFRGAERDWLPAGRRPRRQAAGAPEFVGRTTPPHGEGPHEPDLEDIFIERPPRLLSGPHYMVVALFLMLLLLGSVLKVDVVVAAHGRLVPDGPPIVMQPLERAVIREIHVKVGDTVHKGDVLATLDATFTEADSASLTAQQNALRAQIQRVEAELEETPLTSGRGTKDELLQLKLFTQRQAQYNSRLDGFDAEISLDRTAIRAANDSRTTLSHQLDIARQIEAMRGELFKGNTGSKLSYLEAQAARMGAEKEFQAQTNKSTELQQTLKSAEAERQTFVDSWRRELLEDLAKARSDYSKVTENLTKATRLNDLVALTAPQDGIVLDIAKRSVGSVLHEAEPLITLVPLNTPLIAEVMISSADVGYTKPGDEVVVKVDAFPFERHGALDGKLRSIGEDSFSSAASVPGAATAVGGAFHRSEVSLTATDLRNLPEGTHLIPGMTATAEIKVGSRSVLSYFLYPLSRNLSESFREP